MYRTEQARTNELHRVIVYKIKCTVKQDVKTQRESRGITYLLTYSMDQSPS